MYTLEIEDRDFGLKPMNCPAHCLIYKNDRHSYRDLPLRMNEVGLVPPQRAERHAARPHARPAHHAGRRAHLLHHGAGRGGGLERPRLRHVAVRAVRHGVPPGAVDAAREPRGLRRGVGSRRGDAGGRARPPRPAVRRQRGRRRLLRPEDRRAPHRLDRALLAVRHVPARLQPARALRPRLHRRGRPRAPAGDDPPRDAGLVRALHRHPDRALRRRVPALAGADAGRRAADLRPPPPVRGAGRRAARGRRPPRAGRPARRVDRQEDRRVRGAQGPGHAGGRRPRVGGRGGRRCGATAGGDLGSAPLDEVVGRAAARRSTSAARRPSTELRSRRRLLS